MHQSPERQPRSCFELGAADRAVIVDVGGPELPLHQSEKLVLVHGAIMIAIGPTELVGRHAKPAKLGTGKFAGVTTVEAFKSLRGGAFRFLEIDGAIAVTIDAREGAGPPAPACERGGHRDAAREPKQKQLPPQRAVWPGGHRISHDD